MIEIRSTTEALTAAQRLLDASALADTGDLWQSYAVSPLAAILLATAHANAGLVDLTAVRDVVAGGPGSEADDPFDSGWLLVAQRCPNPLLSSALQRTAGLKPRQRDSVRVSVLAALARS